MIASILLAKTKTNGVRVVIVRMILNRYSDPIGFPPKPSVIVANSPMIVKGLSIFLISTP